MANRLAEIEYAHVPGSAREKLQSRIRAQHLFTLSMMAELYRILPVFALSEIDAVLVKGPLLSQIAYANPAVRGYADLDLLVRQRDIGRATERMAELGFLASVPQAAIAGGRIPGEYCFRKPATPHMVELHTQETFRYYPKPMPIEELLARKRSVSLEGKPVPALRLEDEFVFDCIHGAKDFWARLVWVSDIAGMIAKHPEMSWEEVRERSAGVGAGRMVRVAIRLAARVLGVSIPEVLYEEIQKDRETEGLCESIERWQRHGTAALPALSRRAKFRLDMAGGGLHGVAYLARLSLSPTQEDWAKGAEQQRSWLWGAVRRPLRLFRKYSSSE